jgi:hypothetical protein
LRNDAIFGKGEASISNSISFISNYLNTTTLIKNGWNEYDRKGKGKITYTPEYVAKMCKSTDLLFHGEILVQVILKLTPTPLSCMTLITAIGAPLRGITLAKSLLQHGVQFYDANRLKKWKRWLY